MDKPAGPTSHDVVARVRRVMGTRAVGHSGTLDPFATGLLVVLLGRATRLARFVERQQKTYRGIACLGVSTDTDDATGVEVARVVPARWPDRAGLEAVMASLTGSISQVPPAYSAKLVGGRRSYQLARAGQAVPLAAVAVEVARFEVLEWSAPHLEFRATVSAGTYLRALARDLGDRLGLGGHLTMLRREAIGALRVAEAVPLEGLHAGMPLVSPSDLLAHFPAVEISAEEALAVAHGRGVRRPGAVGRARLLHEGSLVAVGEARDDGWHPVVVLEGK